MDGNSLAIIGVPLDLGAENLGVADGPAVFRAQRIVEKLDNAGFNTTDIGDIHVAAREDVASGSPQLKHLTEVVRVNQELAQHVDTQLSSGAKAVVLGGDHSLNLGAFAGAKSAVSGTLGMIYLDAHGDMNTPETTLSGNIHGMHLAALMGLGAPEMVNLHREGTKLDFHNLLHIGGSDLDQAEIELMTKQNIPTFTLFDLLTKGLGALLPMIDELIKRTDAIWISLDLDSIDQIYAPGAGMPNTKGLVYREIATIAEYVGSRANIAGIDVVEYNPHQDIDFKTAELATELIAKFLGKDYSWYTNYLAKNKV